ncbi:hypothetical protein ACVWWN_000180 [Mycobacterium sp. URHB0021]
MKRAVPLLKGQPPTTCKPGFVDTRGFREFTVAVRGV